jgi:hypothetical protein
MLAPNSVQKQAANGTKTRSFWSKVEPMFLLLIWESLYGLLCLLE